MLISDASPPFGRAEDFFVDTPNWVDDLPIKLGTIQVTYDSDNSNSGDPTLDFPFIAAIFADDEGLLLPPTSSKIFQEVIIF